MRRLLNITKKFYYTLSIQLDAKEISKVKILQKISLNC
jgi:hypothetical protein